MQTQLVQVKIIQYALSVQDTVSCLGNQVSMPSFKWH